LTFLTDLDQPHIIPDDINYDIEYVPGSLPKDTFQNISLYNFVEGLPGNATIEDIKQWHSENWTTLPHGDIENWLIASGPNIDYLIIENNNFTTFDWREGCDFNFEVGTDYGEYSGVATLTEVSSNAPVPEPSTILFFGTGLVGLASVRLRKRKAPRG